MTTEDWEKIISIAECRWNTNQTLTDNDISRISSHIISTPAVVQNQGSEIKLFTTEQMYEMFRLGFYIRQKVGIAKRSVKIHTTPRGQSTFARIRKLEVGQKLVLPISEYGAARSAASTFNKTYGTSFRVNKLSEEDILVTRNA